MRPAVRYILRGMAAILLGAALGWLLAGCGGGGCETAAECAAAEQPATAAPQPTGHVPTPAVDCAANPGQCT